MPSDLRETVLAYATVEPLREAVERSDLGCRKDTPAARHAAPILRIIVTTAELSGDGVIEASIVVGPEEAFGCKITVGEARSAATAPAARVVRADP